MMYDRGGMEEQHEEKKHKGAAIVMFLVATTLLAFYSYWLKQTNNLGEDWCCAYYDYSLKDW